MTYRRLPAKLTRLSSIMGFFLPRAEHASHVVGVGSEQSCNCRYITGALQTCLWATQARSLERVRLAAVCLDGFTAGRRINVMILSTRFRE